MSSKTRNRNTHIISTSGTSRALRPVSDQPTAAKARTDTEEKLWATLGAHPNSTAADLASTAEIGKSTAQKILAKWADDGLVTRTAGIAQGGRRAADLWAITDDRAEVTPIAETVLVAQDTAEADDTEPDRGEDAEPTSGAHDAQHSSDADETASVEAVVEATTSADADTADAGDGDKARLAPGALRGMVEDFFRNNPDQDHGPAAIAKGVGGRSSGAVSNCCDKLVELGTVVQTNQSPKRFRLAPEEVDATSPSPASPTKR